MKKGKKILKKISEKISKKKLVVLILLAFVVGSGSFATYKIIQKKRQAALAIEQPTSLIDIYRNELPELEKKVAQNGDDPKALRDYAVALYATGDVQKAKDGYLKEAKVNGKDPILYNNLANAYRDGGQYDDAISAYQKSIELDAKNPTPYINLANLYIYTLKKADLGIEIYNKGIAANPDNMDLEVLLGMAYAQSGDKEKAKAAFEAVLKKKPDNAAAKAGLDRLNSAADSKNN